MGILVVLGAAFLFGLPALAIAAWLRASGALRQTGRLDSEIADLRRRLALAEGRFAATDAPGEAGPQVAPRTPPEDLAVSAPEPQRASVPSVGRRPPPRIALPEPPVRDEGFAARWLVRLGGLTLALGGAFLVKYSIDEGLLGPAMRIALGLLLALLLIAGGEWLRRRHQGDSLPDSGRIEAPSALSAAGVFTAFATIWAGYALYGFFGPLLAFLMLAGIAMLALGLALLHGPLVAALGLVGAYAVPILVSTGASNPWTLFGYVLAISAGGLAIVRHLAKAWLLWLVIAGTLGWILIWCLFVWDAGDGAALGTFILLALLAFTLLRGRSHLVPVGDTGWRDELRLFAMPMPERAFLFACGGLAAAAFALVRIDHYGPHGIAAFSLFAALAILIGRREQIFANLPRLAGIAALALIALWHLPRLIAAPVISDLPWDSPILPPEFGTIVTVAAIWAALFLVGGFAALHGAARPVHWASLSAATPVGLLLVLYGRLNRFETDLEWALVAILLAGLLTGLAAAVARKRDDPGMEAALGAYAVSVIAALALAFTMLVEEAWLTVALALELVGIAWVARRLELAVLQGTAWLLAIVIIARLLLNPEIFAYAIDGSRFGFNWLLYGYGIPAAAFLLARRLFGPGAPQSLTEILEAGALGFVAAFLALEIHHLMTPDGRLDRPPEGLFEAALVSITWLAVALALMRREQSDSGRVARLGWRVLMALAAGAAATGQLLVFNPLWWPWPGGTLAAPFVNVLLLAYAAPAGLALAVRREAGRRGMARLDTMAGVAALVLGFVWLNLAIRHAFKGGRMELWHDVGNGEMYAYSAAWLGFGLLLFGLGTRFSGRSLRRASMLVVMLTVAKVFLLDMAALTGLWRVLSFLGLGLALVGIGWLYQRQESALPEQRPT